MAGIGWTSDAQAAILAGARVETGVLIDVEQDGTGSYGGNVVDVTDYVLEYSTIKTGSSIIEKDWELHPFTVLLDNSSGYFTPNIAGGSRDELPNVWQTRPSGEASLRECKVLVKQTVTLPDDTTETVDRIEAMIVDYELSSNDDAVTAELVTRDSRLDALGVTFSQEDGESDTFEWDM